MLLNKEGKAVNVPVLHKQAHREAVLAPLREVLIPERTHGMFKLGVRAHEKEVQRERT